jgi:putative phosphoesterase
MNKVRGTTIGVLSDTHRTGIDDRFRSQTKSAFARCDTIVHAGDLISQDILSVFEGKHVYAVHGNMCSFATRSRLPESISFRVNDYQFGLCHGHRFGRDLETGLIARFPGADCIIFGHTHHPLVQRFAQALLVNPGSFRGTGRYGSLPSYAIISVEETGLSATLHSLKEGF